MAVVICSRCGNPNPEELETCQFCGSSLRPPPESKPVDPQAIHAGDLPIRKMTSDLERAMRAAGEGTILPGQEPTKKTTGELESSLPPWLQSLRQSGPKSPEQVFQEDEAKVPQTASPNSSGQESSDWLSGLESASAAPDAPIPDWLTSLRPAGTFSRPAEQETQPLQAPPAAAPHPELPAAQIPGSLERFITEPPVAAPDLQSIPAVPTNTAEQAPEDQPSPASEVPPEISSWQDRDRPNPPAAEPTSSSGFPQGQKLPDWLSDLPTVSSEAPAAEAEPAEEPTNPVQNPVEEGSAPPPPPERAVPSWLAQVETGTEAPPGRSYVFLEEPSQGTTPPGEIPEWLAQFKTDITPPDQQVGKSEPGAPVPEKQELPSWLVGVESTGPASNTPALTAGTPGTASGGIDQGDLAAETPDWLARLKPSKKAATAQAPQEPEEGEAGNPAAKLEAAELPIWVQALRPVEAAVSEARASGAEGPEAVEETGPLAGLSGVLPAGPGLGKIRKPPAYSIKLQVTDNQQRYAASLEQMVMDEQQAKHTTAAGLKSSRLWRWGVALVLILAVAFPLVTGSQVTPITVAAPALDVTHSLIAGLPSNAPVLVAFDYEPALSGELQAVAEPVMHDLLSRNPRLTLISTSPTGPALAEYFMQTTQAAALSAGLQYVDLGYLAGGPSGIQDFAEQPEQAAPRSITGGEAWQTSALQGVNSLSDFAALFVLTDSSDTGRAWIEQAAPYLNGKPIVMIVSAQAEPMIEPYYASGQLKGLVTGLSDGMAYAQKIQQVGLAREDWDAFSLGIYAAVLLIICGSLWSGISLQRSRRKSGAKP